MRDLLNQMPLGPPPQQPSAMGGLSSAAGTALSMFMQGEKDAKRDAMIKALMGNQAPQPGAGVPLGVGGPVSLMPQVNPMTMPAEGMSMGMFGGGVPPIY